ncbi:MAG: glycosyltransferase [Pseudomonadota bacterium]
MRIPHITILMATFNGAAFLDAQLQSIRTQLHENWTLIISDDGSDDETLSIIQQFCAAYPSLKIQLITGPAKGSSENFWHLVGHIPAWSDYVAFADQDDVWMPQKLTRAISALAPVKTAGLYGACSIEVDANLCVLGRSARIGRGLSLKNALVQNVFSCNSCVVNRTGIDILRKARGRGYIFDWYLYQLFAAIDAELIHDPQPSYYYRQHTQNQIGANRGLCARLFRMGQMLSGQFRSWNQINIDALWADKDLMTEANQRILDRFQRVRTRIGFSAAREVWKIGLVRQGPIGQMGLYVSAILGRL